MTRAADQALRSLLEKLADVIVGDTDYADALAEARIVEKVQAGELVTLSALQVVPGLELVPLGRLSDLTDLVAAFVAHPVVKKSADQTLAQLVVRAGALVGDDEPVAKPAKRARKTAKKPAAVEPDPQPGAPKEADARRRPKGMPGPDDGPFLCKDHHDRGEDVPIDYDQVKVSWSRFRKPLCIPCMATQE